MPRPRKETHPDPTRRALLGRLGLALTMAYAAPMMTRLTPARASEASGPSGSSGSFSAPPRRRTPPVFEFVALVEDGETAAARLAAAGCRLIAALPVPLLGATLLRIAAPGRDAAAALAVLQAALPESRIAPNDLYTASEFGCGDAGCAAFELIDWPAPAGCALAPAIGMVDTGVNAAHPALAASRLEILAIEQAERHPAGPVHGTAVAALLVGDPESRTPGLLPRARLVAVNAFYAGGSGEAADAFSLVAALDRLAGQEVDIVNMSLAGPDNSLLAAAVAAVLATGVPIVAAAGNAGPHAGPLYPAAYPGVVAVTAVDAGLAVYRQAVQGEHIAFAAPGVKLWTAASVSGGRFRSGTSYATPFVTAALAAALAEEPEAGAALARLAAGATDLGATGRDAVFGWGLVQAGHRCG